MALVQKVFAARPIGPTFKTVRLATAAALPACTPAGTGVGHTLTGNANGALTVDATALVVADRVLVKNQVAQDDNGIYVVTTVGAGGAAFVLTRATDFDAASASEITNGVGIWVTAGATNISTSWILNQASAITVDTTSLPFVAGNGDTDTVSTWDVLGHDISTLENASVGITVVATEAQAPLVGVVRVEVANGELHEMKGNALDWRACPGLIVDGTPVTDGDIDVSGTTEIEIDLPDLTFGWLRLTWVGTTGEGTLTANYLGKRTAR